MRSASCFEVLQVRLKPSKDKSSAHVATPDDGEDGLYISEYTLTCRSTFKIVPAFDKTASISRQLER